MEKIRFVERGPGTELNPDGSIQVEGRTVSAHAPSAQDQTRMMRLIHEAAEVQEREKQRQYE